MNFVCFCQPSESGGEPGDEFPSARELGRDGEKLGPEDSGLDPSSFKEFTETLDGRDCLILEVAIQGPRRGHPVAADF